jgi:gluconate 2-dehydrogenase gamma chain
VVTQRAFSRRRFLRDGSIYGGTLWIALNVPRPGATRAAAESERPVVLNEDEWKTVEAITGRIIPSDHEPGAIEANCVNFIDKALANEDAAARPLYAQGVVGVNRVARGMFEAPFAALPPARQDEVLAALEEGRAPGWSAASIPSAVFFETLCVHTIIGFLADPKYGGNRGYAGWKVTGYPGPRHQLGGYMPEQMVGKQKIKTVWGDEV